MGKKQNSSIFAALLLSSTFASIILIKYVVSTRGFVFPCLVAMIQLFCAWLGSYAFILFTKRGASPKPRFNVILIPILPFSIVLAASTSLLNLSLRWIPISFHQTFETIVPASAVIVDLVVSREWPRDSRVIATFGPIATGVFVAATFERYFEWMGLFACILYVAIMGFWEKALLTFMTSKLDLAYTLFYCAPVSIALLFPFMRWFEWNTIFERWPAEYTGSSILFVLIVSSCVVALNLLLRVHLLATFSPVTQSLLHNISSGFSYILGVVIFRNSLSLLSILGAATAFGGAWWYSQILFENKSPKPSELPDISEPSLSTSHAARRNIIA